MKKKNTDDLREELMAASDIKEFLRKNRSEFVSPDITETLNSLLNKNGISKAALAKRSSTSEVFLYQVFSGARKPSRNRLLCLCFGLNATLDETQELLKKSGYAQLYPKNRRDAILMHCIISCANLFEVDEKLFSEGEETLS